MDNQKIPAGNPQRVVSDARVIVRRHLSDPNHVITEEEIASIRVGIAATTHLSAENNRKRKLPDNNSYKNASWEIIE